MENQKFKCIKGSYEEGQPAHIYFYSDVNSWRVEDFIYEFKYLMNYVKPSEINVHINSGGGNCVDGISVFSLIQDCEIPTNTINDGIAASMGSVIWAAGDKQYMRDYAILMIHNPFADAKDKATQQAVDAFKKTLSVIYQKRFGLGEAQVEAIMDGKKDEDGTWMSAQEAVNNGFIAQSHIIETPQAVKDKIAASISGITDALGVCAEMGKVMNEVDDAANYGGGEETVQDGRGKKAEDGCGEKPKDGCGKKAEDECKNPKDECEEKDTCKKTDCSTCEKLKGKKCKNSVLFNKKKENDTITAQNNFNSQNLNNMNEQFTVVAALLGLAGNDATQEKVSADIKNLLDIKGKFEGVQAELAEVKTKLTGSEAAVANLTKNLDETKAALKVYQDAEAKAKEAEIEAMVDDAIKACKIEKESKEAWVNMAKANLELAKSTLASIPARENIEAGIAEGENGKGGEAPKSPIEKEIEAKVAEVVGKDFQFKKLS